MDDRKKELTDAVDCPEHNELFGMLSKAALSHWNSRRPINNETGNSTSAEGEGRETSQNM